MLWESFDEPVPTAISRAHLRGEFACWPSPERLGSALSDSWSSLDLSLFRKPGASPDDPGKTSKAASGVAAATISGRVTDQAGAPLADVRVTVRVGDPETRASMPAHGPGNFSPDPTPGGIIGLKFPVSRSARSS